jgi:hypothetical protein
MDHPSALLLFVPDPFHPALLLFAAALAFVVATYAGYPVAIWLWARLRPVRPPDAPESCPAMTMSRRPG